jgi:hypothetical protein
LDSGAPHLLWPLGSRALRAVLEAKIVLVERTQPASFPRPKKRYCSCVSEKAFDRIAYVITLARLSILDRLAGPPSETSTDIAIREHGERLRNAFPQADFDNPRRHVR